MENIIAKLLQDFEQGKMNRRQLIQSLAMTAAVAGATGSAVAAEGEKKAFKAVAVNLPIGANEYLLAAPGITSIAQLRGKPVAYTTGTAEQAFALRALKSAGLTQRDVKQVNVTLLQLGTVLESGAADASVVSVETCVSGWA